MITKADTECQEENVSAGRLVNFRPVFISALFLMLGILIGYYRVVEEKSVIVLIVLVLLFPAFFFFFVKRKLRFVKYLVVFYLSFFIGMTGFSLSVSRHREVSRYDGECFVLGTVIEKNVGMYGGEIVLTDLTIDRNVEDGKMTVTLSEEDFVAIKCCDRVLFRMDVSTVNTVVGTYGFRAEAIADREIYRGSNVVWYQIQGYEFHLGAYLRDALQGALYAGMDEESAAVATAILLGNTSGIETELLQNIRYGGIAHIFAVSGLHIGAVFAFCMLLLRRNRIPAPLRFVFVAVILVLYGGICGYSASVVRSIVTCLILYGCTLIGVKYDSLESLSLAAYVVFAIYPTLLFGVGAQLSFCACLGIVLLSKPLRRGMEAVCFGVVDGIRYGLLKREKPKPVDMFCDNTSPKSLLRQATEKCISFLSVSFAAQIGTAPILYLSFGYFSIVSIFLNCIYVPMMTFCFSPLLLLASISALLSSLAGVLLYVPNVLLHLAVLAFHLISFENGIIDSLSFGAPAVVCYYCAVLFASDKCNLSKWHKRALTLLFIASFAVCVVAGS